MIRRRVHSCGALFFTVDPKGTRGVILGKENDKYFVFKGCPSEEEIKKYGADQLTLFRVTAQREILEETCGLINIDYRKLKLEHTFKKKNDDGDKIYHIALVYVPYTFINDFEEKRKVSSHLPSQYLEKTTVKFFPLSEIKKSKEIHQLTKRSIYFYLGKMNSASIISKGPVIQPKPQQNNILQKVYDIIACSTPISGIVDLLSPLSDDSKKMGNKIKNKFKDWIDKIGNSESPTPIEVKQNTLETLLSFEMKKPEPLRIPKSPTSAPALQISTIEPKVQPKNKPKVNADKSNDTKANADKSNDTKSNQTSDVRESKENQQVKKIGIFDIGKFYTSFL